MHIAELMGMICHVYFENKNQTCLKQIYRMKNSYYSQKPRKVNVLKFFAVLSLLVLGANFTNAQTCSANAGNLSLQICETEEMLLEGVNPGGTNTVEWVQISGPAVIIVSPNSVNTSATGYIGGNTYVFRYNVTCGDGSGVAFQDKTIIVEPITQATASSGSLASCPDATGSLIVTGNTPLNPGETGYWRIPWANDAVVTINFDTSETTTLTLDPNACGTTTIQWVIEGPEFGSPPQQCIVIQQHKQQV